MGCDRGRTVSRSCNEAAHHGGTRRVRRRPRAEFALVTGLPWRGDHRDRRAPPCGGSPAGRPIPAEGSTRRTAGLGHRRDGGRTGRRPSGTRRPARCDTPTRRGDVDPRGGAGIVTAKRAPRSAARGHRPRPHTAGPFRAACRRCGGSPPGCRRRAACPSRRRRSRGPPHPGGERPAGLPDHLVHAAASPAPRAWWPAGCTGRLPSLLVLLGAHETPNGSASTVRDDTHRRFPGFWGVGLVIARSLWGRERKSSRGAGRVAMLPSHRAHAVRRLSRQDPRGGSCQHAGTEASCRRAAHRR